MMALATVCCAARAGAQPALVMALVPLTFPYAVAGATCTQEDIPGLEIVMSERPWNGQDTPPAPYLRIEAAGLVAESPIRLDLSPLRRDPHQRSFARAALHDERGAAEWLSGSIRIERLIAGRSVAGGFVVCRGDSACMSGDFQASWRPGTARCG